MNKVKALSNAVLMSVLMSTSVVWGTTAFAADNLQEYSLDTMVITATRTPVEAFDANANISVIMSKDIERQHYMDIKEAVRNAQGVTITDYGRAGYENSNALRINGTDKVIILVDGVRISQSQVNPLASTQFVPIENVERIEVLKGSASALYGADAKGGVVNIITKQPDGINTKLIASGGNFGQEEYSFIHQGKSKNLSYRINAKKRLLDDAKDGNGDVIPRYLDGETLGFEVKNTFSEGTDVTVSYDKYQSDYMYDDKFYGGNITKGHNNNDAWSVIYNQKINDNMSNQLSVKRLGYDSEYGNDTYTSISYDIKSFVINDQFSAKLSDNHNLIIGAYYQNDDVDYKNIYPTTPPSLIKTKIISKALFLQENWDITDKWNFNTGLRYDKHSIAGNAFTPKFNLGYKADDKNNYYVSYGRFFVAPGVSNYYHGRYGNPNLKPEKGYSVELGYNHKFDDSFESAVHLFNRKSNDSIGYWSGKYNNITEEKAKGVDIQLRKFFNENFSTSLGYTWITTEEKTPVTGAESKNINGYLPKHAVNIGIAYNDEKWNAGIDVRGALNRKGKYDGFFPCNNYWIVDTAVNYQATKNIKFFGKVNNLFDKFYAEHSAASSKKPEDFYAMPGRTFILGMEYAF